MICHYMTRPKPTQPHDVTHLNPTISDPENVFVVLIGEKKSNRYGRAGSISWMRRGSNITPPVAFV